MSDEERRRRVVDWMRREGDPWMRAGRSHTPSPRSALAADDAATPHTSTVAVHAIMMALDHLGSVVDAVESGRPMRHYAPFTTLRTTLEASARVRWMLKPDLSVDRQVRGLCIRHANEVAQRRAIRGLAGRHLSGEEERALNLAVAAIDGEIEALEERANVLGASSLALLDTVSMLLGMVDVNTSDGSGIIQLWRVGSASAHGYYWADQMRDNPGQFDHKGFHAALYGATIFLNEAMRLHHRRATED
jgi:hypothetical protein